MLVIDWAYTLHQKEPTEILRAAPGKGMWCGDIRATGEELSWLSRGAQARATSPVLKAGLDQTDTDEHDRGTGDDGSEDAEHDLWREEGDQDFNEGAHSGCADDSTVAFGAGEWRAILGGRAVPIGVHLGEGALCNGDDGERDTNDGDQARADVVTMGC